MTFTRNQLKQICLIAMTINHIGVIFQDVWNHPIWFWFYHTIGWLVFPILINQLVEGFEKTRNVTRYQTRLFIAYVCSILPYQWMYPNAPITGNILWTLSIALGYLRYRNRYPIFALCLGLVLTYSSDWSIFGVLFVYLRTRWQQTPEKSVGMIGVCVLILYSLQGNIKMIMTLFGFIIAIYLLKCYNGIQRPTTKGKQSFFYFYYSIHLAVICWLHTLYIN